MRFIHFADTHLGRAAFSKVNPDTGENVREASIHENFLATIDQFIKLRPDFIIHAGDLFDTVKPKNKSLVVALDGLERLEHAGIPLFAIAGNHSMIKARHTSSPFNVLRFSAHQSILAHEFRPFEVKLEDCMIHMIPNMHHKEEYNQAFSKLKPDPNLNNILVMHGLASGIKDKRLNTMCELEIDPDISTSDDYMYKALGHYHNQEKISPGTWYSGSLEHLTYGEIHDSKGAMLVDKYGANPIQNLPKVNMFNEGPVNCDGMTPADITDVICKSMDRWYQIDKGHMGQVILRNLSQEKASALDYVKINEVSSNMMHLKLKRESVDKVAISPDSETIKSIDYHEEYGKYIRSLNLGSDEDKVISQGREILKQALGAS